MTETKQRFNEYMTKRELKRRFLINDKFIGRFFPTPVKISTSKNSNKLRDAWPVSVVEEIMQRKNFQHDHYSTRGSEPNAKKRKTVRKALIRASSINTLFESVPNAGRNFVLHIGPTNSGKTYHALKRFAKAENGIYLAPLRLLALEIFDTLNYNGVFCSLLTGEEREDVPFAKVLSSTIETCCFDAHYDVAVIDECQLIADERRGQHWTKAILQLNADEIHLCLAPEAADLIISLLNSINASYTVNYYERLAPLKFSGTFKHLADIQPGDALIAFSRKKVLAIAAALEDMGVKTSVIYGWLPPAARREEIRRFNSGKSTVVVATDAIGMGVSLPIKRIIFCETDKWDYGAYRPLSIYEIRQIAGRAGRYGKFDAGEVLSMTRPEHIQSALAKGIVPLKRITLPFPQEVITGGADLKIYLEEWERLLLDKTFRRERMTEALILLKFLKNDAAAFATEDLFKLIRCPFNTSDPQLMSYWRSCCLAINNGEALPLPEGRSDNLTDCEVQYRAYEIRYRLANTFGFFDDFLAERQRLCIKINNLLIGDKTMFIARCKECGKRLPVTHSETLCNDCLIKEADKKAAL